MNEKASTKPARVLRCVHDAGDDGPAMLAYSVEPSSQDERRTLYTHRKGRQMASFARMRRTLKRIRSFPLASRDSIKRNIRRGLLCACNMENVPYYGSDIPDGSSGECHGFTVKDGIRHGYDDCCKL